MHHSSPPNPLLNNGTLLDEGRYELLRPLGRGGNSHCWLARQRAVGCDVAIKFPFFHGAIGDESMRQFRQETRSLATFSNRHPHIVNIIDVSSHGGRPYVVMQWMANGSLNEAAYRPRGDDPAAKADLGSFAWIAQIGDALDFLHAHAIVHRDVKPGNILLDESWSAYLADFGTSVDRRLPGGAANDEARSQRVPGSLPFMATEILRGGASSAKSDQYSLAVSVYAFLTGTLPFNAGDARAMVDQHQRRQIAPIASIRPEFDSSVDRVLARAMHPRPENRYPTCREFAEELARQLPSTPPLSYGESLSACRERDLGMTRRDMMEATTDHDCSDVSCAEQVEETIRRAPAPAESVQSGAGNSAPLNGRPSPKRRIKLARVLREDCDS